MQSAKIALVGDYSPKVTAHQAIERSFALAADAFSPQLSHTWLGTRSIVAGDPQSLSGVNGLWCVPASPYESEEGALWAIRLARQNRIPFLGTCGGFQHALLEYARNVLGLVEAEHAETHPAAEVPFISRLECSLVEANQEIKIAENTWFRSVYGSDAGIEPYRCSYGLNPKFEETLAAGGLEVVARDANGAARAFSLKGHPFFVGTLFQPERRALTGSLHPIVRAFLIASSKTRMVRG